MMRLTPEEQDACARLATSLRPHGAEYADLRILLTAVDRLTTRQAPQSDDEAWLASIRLRAQEGAWSPSIHRGDLSRLLAAIDERDRLLDVMCQDGTQATDLARTDAFAEVVAWLREESEGWGNPAPLLRTADALEHLRSLHRAPPSLPPDRARAYADQSRACVRGWWEWYRADREEAPAASLLDDTRRLLGEGQP